MPYKNIQGNTKKHPWIGQVTIRLPDGKKKTYNQRAKTKKEALEWEDEKKRELREGPKTGILSLLEWANAYLDYVKDNQAEKTFQEKQFAFKSMFKYISPAASITYLTANEIRKYLEKEAKLRTPHAANKQRKNLSAAWTWGVRYLDLPYTNPVKQVIKRPAAKHPRRIPTLVEFWKVHDCCASELDQRMLRLAAYTGARRGEIFRLTWDDVDFANNTIQLWSMKNQHGVLIGVKIKMISSLTALLREQYQVTGKQKFVFMYEPKPNLWLPYINRQHFMRRLCQKAGVERFGFHGIRHLSASIMAAAGVPLVEIQNALRHTNVRTTSEYIHTLEEENGIQIAGLSLLEQTINQARKNLPDGQGGH